MGGSTDSKANNNAIYSAIMCLIQSSKFCQRKEFSFGIHCTWKL